MLLHWIPELNQRWRRLQIFSQFQHSVPWLVLALSLLLKECSAHNGGGPVYHQSQMQPSVLVQQQYHNPPPQGGQMMGGIVAAQQQQPQQQTSLLTGPSAPPNYYYQIDNGNKLVQRQLPPGGGNGAAVGGLTAAATNYLIQQIEMERQQQQQRQFQPSERSGPVPMHALPPQNSPQAQTLQLLAGLTPQQIAALQQVLPRSNQLHFQPQAQASSVNAPVAVLPPPGAGHSMDPQQFSSRMGPFDKFINKAKSWLPDMMGAGSAQSKSSQGEPKMRDLHRLPKPPQYPLYDLQSIGMATPPPAPIMHPMASLPNGAFDWDNNNPVSPPSSSPRSTFNQQNWMSPNPTASTSRRSRPSPRPPKPSKPSFFRNPLARPHKKSRPSPEPPVNYNRRNHGPPPPGRQPPSRGSRPRNPPPKTPKKTGPPRGRNPPPRSQRPPSSGPTSDPFQGAASGPVGFNHPMASNLSPAESPSLGRPLGYEEYMARPSHSYTDDPWNFDPFANQMNQGLHTHALRYNYDPLGMNALDTEANSHLDPNKLSYPGDSFNQDMVKDSPGIGSQAQIGGWDKPYKKRPYNGDPETELTPPGSNPGFIGGSSSFSSSPSDPFQPPSVPSSSGGRYKNGDSDSNNNSPPSSSSGGTGYLGDSLSGGRRGDYPADTEDEGSSYPSYGQRERQRERGRNGNRRNNNAEMERYEPANNDEAPTIDLESLTPPQEEDGMSGLEFTIETSMDKGANGPEQLEAESAQPDPHILGPMQPAPNPYLSDQYSPYGEQSAPVASSVPGVPYGPNGYRERYGRRRTRNNHNAAPPPSQRRTRTRTHQQQQRAVQKVVEQGVPEGVQIFNEIIRPQLQQSSTQNTVSIHPHHAALRRQLYNAIRQSSRK